MLCQQPLIPLFRPVSNVGASMLSFEQQAAIATKFSKINNGRHGTTDPSTAAHTTNTTSKHQQHKSGKMEEFWSSIGAPQEVTFSMPPYYEHGSGESDCVHLGKRVIRSSQPMLSCPKLYNETADLLTENRLPRGRSRSGRDQQGFVCRAEQDASRCHPNNQFEPSPLRSCECFEAPHECFGAREHAAPRSRRSHSGQAEEASDSEEA